MRIPSSGLLGPDPSACGPLGRNARTTLYAGTSGRGMFKRSEHSSQFDWDPCWTEMNTGLTALRAQSVAVANRPGGTTVLVGISSGGIVRSTDGGVTWENTSEDERTVRGIAVDPSGPGTAYAATGRGVYRSEDDGVTWTPMSAGLPTEIVPEVVQGGPPTAPFTVPKTVRAIAVDPVNPGVVYAAVQGIHTSVDGGANWMPLNGNLPAGVTSGNGTVSAIAINHGPGSHPDFGDLYIASDGPAADAGVYKSTDGGTTWTKVIAGIPAADRSITALALDPLPPAAISLYAGTSTGKVFRTDNGSNWTSVSTGLPGKPVTALVVELADPITIYAALDGAGVYFSENGGFSWQPKPAGLTGLDSLSVVGLALDATQTPHSLYAVTLGRGAYDLQLANPGAPIVLITSPESPHTATSSPVQVAGTVIDDAGVSKVFWSTNRGHAGQATGTTSWSAAVALEPGLNIITITAVDIHSNEGSAFVTVQFTPPQNPPTVTITTPTSNPTFAATTTPLTIGGTASDDVSVTQVTWTNSLGGSGTASGTTSWTASVPLFPGFNVITVTAHDDAGLTGTDVITVSLPTFSDVPASHIFFGFIEAIAEAGITGGCGTNPPLYCPDDDVRRDQMAVFLLRGIHGGGYQPPPATGTMFTRRARESAVRGLDRAAGERRHHGRVLAGRADVLPRCGGDTQPHGGVPAQIQARGGVPAAARDRDDVHGRAGTHPLAAWIEQLAREGITGGCGPTTYCPDQIVTRGQMAVFITRTFNLPM